MRRQHLGAQQELLRVQLLIADDVRAEAHLYTGGFAELQGTQSVCTYFIELFQHRRRVTGACGVSCPCLISDQRRYNERLPLCRQLGRGGIDQVGVLDAAYPRSERPRNRLRRIGVCQHIGPGARRLIHGGCDFIRRKLAPLERIIW